MTLRVKKESVAPVSIDVLLGELAVCSSAGQAEHACRSYHREMRGIGGLHGIAVRM